MAEPFEDWLFEEPEISPETGEPAIPGYGEDDWLEDIAESRTDVISRDRSLCTVTIWVPFDKYKSAVKYVLGYSWVDAEKKLRRQIPVFHPVNAWLWARAITGVTFHDFTGKEILDWQYAHFYATYTWAKISISFEETNYKVLDDNSPNLATTTEPDGVLRIKEYGRYVFRKGKPYSELIQIDGGMMQAHAPGIPDLDLTNPITGPYVLTRTEKSMFTLTWKEVPLEFIQDDDGRQPKLEAIQKKVNEFDFMGHPAGTLLCEEVDVIPMPSPIATDLFEDLLFTADVIFTFKRHDPTPGDSTVPKRGWNLNPAPRKVAGVQGERLMAWVYYTHDGTLNGKPLLGSYPFEKAFQHHSLA